MLVVNRVATFILGNQGLRLIVEFAKLLNGFYLSVRKLNRRAVVGYARRALEKIDAQIWLFAFGVDEVRLNALEKKWLRRWSAILG